MPEGSNSEFHGITFIRAGTVSQTFAKTSWLWIICQIYASSFIILLVVQRGGKISLSYLCLVSIVPKGQTLTGVHVFPNKVFEKELCSWHENISFLWKLWFSRQETDLKALPVHSSFAGAWSGKALENPGTDCMLCRTAWQLMATWECFSPHWVKLSLYNTLY